MELFLLSNGKLSGESELLGYAKDRIQAVLKSRGITSAVLIPYALIRSDYDERAGALADVLGMAASAVVDRFDQLEGVLKKSCPDLPEEAKTAVFQVIANARNEWIRSTGQLVAESVDAMLAEDGPELDAVNLDGEALA